MSLSSPSFLARGERGMEAGEVLSGGRGRGHNLTLSLPCWVQQACVLNVSDGAKPLLLHI